MTATSPTTAPHYDDSLDATGLNCPLPILKTKVQLNRMDVGQVLHVSATDPHSVVDFEAYCARTGHELVHKDENEGGLYHFYIRRVANARPA